MTKTLTARDLHYSPDKVGTEILSIRGIQFPKGMRVTRTSAASMMAGWHFTIEYAGNGISGSVFVSGPTTIEIGE